ncbi:OmpA family protein [Albimonas sp. CAU 1670]|uniref:OmpA family protein n=1 Tax=Albimonas sp. CAU 1670 TaxID=3032599 RepID=UPI0023DA1D66|nr:OmpA family protein [Albimonas sp. CAU 1670]MDF2231146.1 OmpA family protein [Albimonas sp. CAU 1670]
MADSHDDEHRIEDAPAAMDDAPTEAPSPPRAVPSGGISARGAWTAFGLGLAGLAVLIGPGAWVAAGQAQALAGARANAALSAAGADWAWASADGLVLRLEGRFPEEAARQAALTAIAHAAPTARVEDLAEPAERASDVGPLPGRGPRAASGAPVLLAAAGDVPSAAPAQAVEAGKAAPGDAPSAPDPAKLAPAEPEAPDVPLTLARDGDGITVAGAVHPDLLDALREALAELPDAPELQDATLPSTRPPSDADLALARAAVRALARLASARAEIAPGVLSLSGAPRTEAGGAAAEESPEAVERALRAEAPADATLLLDISRPPPAFSPFRFVLALGPDGPTLLGCDLRDVAERAAVLAAVAALPGPEGRGDLVCRIGVGAPSDRWGAAVAAGIEALGRLGSGRFELIDSDARLVAAPQTPPYFFGRAARALAERLPDDFVLHLSPPPPAAWRPGPSETEEGEPAPPRWFSVALGAEGVTLLGAAPDEASRAAVAAFARARFGAAAVEDRLELTEAAPPPAWRRAALAGVDVMRTLELGSLAFDGEAATVHGISTRPLAAREAAEAAAKFADIGVPARVEVTVNLPALAAKLPLPPSSCIAALQEEVDAHPIQFDPGAARVAKESLPTLDSLAGVLARCDGLTVEIGGHTDSQGRESTNQALSRARAEAVLEGLFARGVSLSRMVARGYGESRPIADNGTEEGRALNRRIAFQDAALADPPDEGEEG